MNEGDGFIETINTLDAYLGSLPGHGVENVRRPLINTMNLADLLPTSSIWTGSATAPCPMYPPLSPALMHCVTVGATPFRLNLHVRDLGHTFMFGPTGAGKSVLLALMALQFRRYAGSQVFAFDFGGSIRAAALGMPSSVIWDGMAGENYLLGSFSSSWSDKGEPVPHLDLVSDASGRIIAACINKQEW